MAEDPLTTISIGALSNAVDIPVATLRTWERRYGYPVAIRKPSGHRRFPIDTVDRLLLVKTLIEHGHKASNVVPASADTLESLLQAVRPASPSTPAQNNWLEPWIQATTAMQSAPLQWLLQEGWSTMGGVHFMGQRLIPYLQEVGRLWKSGQLTVGQEHHASSVIRQFLSGRWQTLSSVSFGPQAVCATLPHEHHELGLHMAATTLALRGWTLRFLGANTPVQCIAEACQDGTGAVLIGTSPVIDAGTTRQQLVELRRTIGPGTPIWYGGSQAKVPHGIAEHIGDLDQLWARAKRF